MRSPSQRSEKWIAFLSLSALVAIATTAMMAQEQTSHVETERSPAYSSSPYAEPPVVLVSEHDLSAYDARAEEDILWLARCAYSETKRPHEQRLVAWVVRNRVETEYRGQSTYKDIVLDPYQFSAFNPGNRKRADMMALTPDSRAPGWKRALDVAREVYAATGDERPFAQNTRHFYSEQSMTGRVAPVWAHGRRPVDLAGVRVDAKRFRFFAGIASVLAM